MKHCPPEFKADAVALYESRPEATIRSVAADLGVNPETLRNWVRAAGVSRPRGRRAEVPDDPPTAGETENAALRKKVRELEEEREILRKAAKYLRRHRRAIGSRWRRLSAGRQALLTLAHLRMGHTYAQLAAGFGIGTTTAYRYVTEAVELLAALAPSLADAVRTASAKAYLILDGTLLPIDRIAADRPFHSGKHKRHGMNVQVIADPFGRLLWASPALPGAVHDTRAAREHGIVGALAKAGIPCWADKGYRGAGGTVRIPC